jgi:hypothetical protein
MTPIIVSLRSRRRQRALAFQKVQHAVPAFPLFFAGADAIRAGAHGSELALAIVEVVTAGLLISSIARSLRAARAAGTTGLHHPHGIDWIDVFASGVLAAEALERWHTTGHIARPTILLAAVTLTLGLSHSRLFGWASRRRAMRITDEGLYVPGRPFRGFTTSWQNLVRIQITEREIALVRRDGRTRRLDLQDLENAAEVRDALITAREVLAALPPPAALPVTP